MSNDELEDEERVRALMAKAEGALAEIRAETGRMRTMFAAGFLLGSLFSATVLGVVWALVV